jgi:hypothetical protein
MFDPFWNPYIEDQAVDRAHRIGQTREVLVHRLLIENTVEDRIVYLQDQKRELISGALDEGGTMNVTRLDARELAYLFVCFFFLCLAFVIERFANGSILYTGRARIALDDFLGAITNYLVIFAFHSSTGGLGPDFKELGEYGHCFSILSLLFPASF